MIGIIDYGASNLHSVRNALDKLGVTDMRVLDDPQHVDAADKLILPGVGAFGAGMDRLRADGFEEPIKAQAAAGVPLLGICLGMQFLFDESDEMGSHQGLGLLPGRVTRFPEGGLKIPHMGWNQLHPPGQAAAFDAPLLAGIPSGGYAYFVHSYYVEPADDADVLARTDYGDLFASVVGRGNVYGVQFHPEKSQDVGLRILQNFVELSL